MDWFSWLSKTNLHPSLVYDYGLTFARNELQLEDAAFFNHDFLQSMGISIAKHRLEILKLVHSEFGGRRHNKLSGVIKNCVRKCVKKLGFREEASPKETPKEPNWHYQEKWRCAMVRKQGSEELLNLKEASNNNNKPFDRSRTIALSGPLDGRVNEKVMTNKILRQSGPLDGRVSDRMMLANRSPKLTRQIMGSTRSPRSSGPLDSRMIISRSSDARPESPMRYSPYVNKDEDDFDFDGDDHALWPTLFQDLKPT